MRTRRIKVRRVHAAAFFCVLWSGVALAKPPPGPEPAPGQGGAKDVQPAPEDEQHRRYSDAVDARDVADRRRAVYEQARKPGKPADDAAEAEFDDVVRAYEEAIDRDATDDEVAAVVAESRLRLAGAYVYVGRHEKAVEAAKQAVDDAVPASAGEISACLNVGLIYLQAMHKPGEAMPWLKRAQSLALAVAENDEAAKWTTATGDAVRRCEQALKELKAKN